MRSLVRSQINALIIDFNMKYYNYQITTAEIPDEITLCINISNCPIHCPDCHSKFLWEDVGVELTKDELFKMIDENPGVSCVCFMGGDKDMWMVRDLTLAIRNKYKDLKVAWYSGQAAMHPVMTSELDYYKYGPYIKFCGGLDHRTTNQRLYKIDRNMGKAEDITSKFWK